LKGLKPRKGKEKELDSRQLYPLSRREEGEKKGEEGGRKRFPAKPYRGYRE